MVDDYSKRFFGCHVSVAGGLENGIKNGQTLGANTIQVHASPPQRWNRSSFKSGIENELLSIRSAAGIKRIFFHAIYLINLASGSSELLERSKHSLVFYLELLGRISGDGVIVHVGSAKDFAVKEECYLQVAQAIDWILENSPSDSHLLLEVAAGSGRIIGDRMEELAAIRALVKQSQRVFYALDTQHMWASGYDIRDDLVGVIEKVRKILGIDRVACIHLNDSMTELGSRRDRHANIGEGLIGEGALKAFINHPDLQQVPVVLETPALKNIDTAAPEVAKLRSMLVP